MLDAKVLPMINGNEIKVNVTNEEILKHVE